MMPLLGALIVSLLSGLATFFAQYMTKKLAIATAAVAAFTAMTGSLYLLMRSIVSGLSSSASIPAQIASWFFYAIPPVSPACISALVTVWSACTLYKWQRAALDIAAKAG